VTTTPVTLSPARVRDLLAVLRYHWYEEWQDYVDQTGELGHRPRQHIFACMLRLGDALGHWVDVPTPRPGDPP